MEDVLEVLLFFDVVFKGKCFYYIHVFLYDNSLTNIIFLLLNDSFA